MQSIYIPELTRQVTQYSKTLEEDVVLKLNLFEYLYFVEIYKSRVENSISTEKAVVKLTLPILLLVCINQV